MPPGLAGGGRRPYDRPMPVLPPLHSPRTAIKDLAAFLRGRSREQFLGAVLAILVTIIIVIVFLVDSKINTAPPPRVTYVELYPQNRTDADIKADQAEDSARRKAFQEERKRQYRELEKKLGM